MHVNMDRKNVTIYTKMCGYYARVLIMFSGTAFPRIPFTGGAAAELQQHDNVPKAQESQEEEQKHPVRPPAIPFDTLVQAAEQARQQETAPTAFATQYDEVMRSLEDTDAQELLNALVFLGTRDNTRKEEEDRNHMRSTSFSTKL